MAQTGPAGLKAQASRWPQAAAAAAWAGCGPSQSSAAQAMRGACQLARLKARLPERPAWKLPRPSRPEPRCCLQPPLQPARHAWISVFVLSRAASDSCQSQTRSKVEVVLGPGSQSRQLASCLIPVAQS